jgi:serine/threonine protein kinase
VIVRPTLPLPPPTQWEELEITLMLGEGSFGRVKICRHHPTGDTYALKCLRKGQIIRYQQVDHIICEKRVLAMCDHPFILKLAGVFEQANEVFMLLELVQGGELFSLLRQNVRFDESQCMLYAAMVTCAFGYLHARKIAHRDLKPENLLFDREGYLKLVDFGFAKVIKDRTWTLCGTPEYLAPEIISNKGHNIGADWWTLGILIYEMLVGHPPFVGENQIETYHKIMRGKYKIPQNFPRGAKDIISRLLVHTPAGRLGCWKNGTRDVTSHDFYRGLSWGKLENKQLPMPHVPPIKDSMDTSCFDEFPEEDNSSWDKYNDQSFAELWKNEFT